MNLSRSPSTRSHALPQNSLTGLKTLLECCQQQERPPLLKVGAGQGRGTPWRPLTPPRPRHLLFFPLLKSPQLLPPPTRTKGARTWWGEAPRGNWNPRGTCSGADTGCFSFNAQNIWEECTVNSTESNSKLLPLTHLPPWFGPSLPVWFHLVRISQLLPKLLPHWSFFQFFPSSFPQLRAFAYAVPASWHVLITGMFFAHAVPPS